MLNVRPINAEAILLLQQFTHHNDYPRKYIMCYMPTGFNFSSFDHDSYDLWHYTI